MRGPPAWIGRAPSPLAPARPCGKIVPTRVDACGYGNGVVWPAAPMLRGITMQLLELKLADCGLPSRRAPVRLPGLASFAAAFVTNARGIAAVGQIDDLTLLVDPELMRTLTQAYESAGWDDI
jgi:hypothetical protein